MTARVGLLVPSSNVTMEIELPALLGQHTEARSPSFHSARMRMTAVTPAALAAMDAQADRCAAELADAQVDVLAYACLVAVMVQGPGSHRATEQRRQLDLHGQVGAGHQQADPGRHRSLSRSV